MEKLMLTKYYILTLCSLFLISCTQPEKEDLIGTEVILTELLNKNSYYNFNNPNDTLIWHFGCIKKDIEYIGSIFSMPSITINDSILVAIFDDYTFEEIISIPENFENNIVTSASLEYKDECIGLDEDNCDFENEVLHYDITSHKLKISNPHRCYIFILDEKSYKLQFLEYSSVNSGSLLFIYSNIN
jgi:hypothetical protein